MGADLSKTTVQYFCEQYVVHENTSRNWSLSEKPPKLVHGSKVCARLGAHSACDKE